MELQHLPELVQIKLLKMLDYSSLRSLRATSTYFKFMVRSETRFFANVCATYNFVNYSHRDFKKFFKFVKKNFFLAVAFNGFKVFNVLALKKIKNYIKKHVTLLKILNYNHHEKDIKILLHKIVIWKIVFINSDISSYNENNQIVFHRKFKLNEDRLFNSNSESIEFNNCSFKFIEEFFNSNILACLSANIMIKCEKTSELFKNISKLEKTIFYFCPFMKLSRFEEEENQILKYKFSVRN